MSNLTILGDTSGSVVLQAPSVSGSTTITMAAQSGTLNVGGPAFYAYKNSGDQSLTSATFTKVTFDTKVFDTNNNFASSTFTPTVAGYYQISGGVSTASSAAITRVIVSAYKNGSGYNCFQDIATSVYRATGSTLVYMNGTTDYVEIYAYMTGTSIALESGIGTGIGYRTWFSGCFLRGA
jgi:hypothetical protein